MACSWRSERNDPKVCMMLSFFLYTHVLFFSLLNSYVHLNIQESKICTVATTLVSSRLISSPSLELDYLCKEWWFFTSWYTEYFLFKFSFFFFYVLTFMANHGHWIYCCVILVSHEICSFSQLHKEMIS